MQEEVVVGKVELLFRKFCVCEREREETRTTRRRRASSSCRREEFG